jgi:hypothetical protein
MCTTFWNCRDHTDTVRHQVPDGWRQVRIRGPVINKHANLHVGQYHWVSELAPPRIQKELSYAVGWLTAMGWQGMRVATPDRGSH